MSDRPVIGNSTVSAMTSNDRPRLESRLPVHVAVVMDGNGRWAQRQGHSRLEGHRRGVENVRTLVEECVRHKIPYLTLFAFSSENWRRPKQEVAWLMRLLDRALEKEIQTLHANGVRLRFIGDISALALTIQKKIDYACELTRPNSRLGLTVAVNYGGQWDLTQAFASILRAVQRGDICADDLSPAMIGNHLATAELPSPDLFIRTGGEKRMSNFLLWQLAYTELYFTDVFWPDFDGAEFALALRSFASRERRFGGAELGVDDKEPQIVQ